MPNVNASSLLPSSTSPNTSNKFVLKCTVGTALANNDTFTITLPSGCPLDLVPGTLRCYTLSSTTYTSNALLAITTHNTSTGVTVLTASGTVAQGALVYLEYMSPFA